MKANVKLGGLHAKNLGPRSQCNWSGEKDATYVTKTLQKQAAYNHFCPYVAITHAGIPTTALQLAHTYLGSYPYTT